MPHAETTGSRTWEITDQDITQRINITVCDDNLAADDLTYGTFWTPNDDIAAAKYIYDNIPTFRVFILNDGSPITLYLSSSRGEDLGGGTWRVELVYTLPQDEQLNNINYVKFGLTTSGGQKKISKSISVRSTDTRTGSSLTPPNTYNIIGASDKKVEGTTILTEALKFNITAYFTPDVWNTSVLLGLRTLTTRYNNNVFYGFAAGEIVFEYATASGEAYKLTPVTYHFIYQPNYNGEPDEGFPPLFALGHDHIEYSFLDDVDPAGLPVRVPHFRRVHQVYKPGNLSLLGI